MEQASHLRTVAPPRWSPSPSAGPKPDCLRGLPSTLADGRAFADSAEHGSLLRRLLPRTGSCRWSCAYREHKAESASLQSPASAAAKRSRVAAAARPNTASPATASAAIRKRPPRPFDEGASREHPQRHPVDREHPDHLHAFEAYRLAGYRKVLLCDGDLLFRRPVGELFDTGDLLLCCPDLVFLTGGRRGAATFAPLDGSTRAPAPRAGALERTFNDGLLVIDRSALGERSYADLLALVTPETWRGAGTPHFKQFLHNRYFAGRHTLIGSTYNYVLLAVSAIRAREGLAAADAKVLHFNPNAKPWLPATMLRWMNGERPVPGFGLWYDAWMDSLSVGHLRAAKRSSRWKVIG